MSKNINNLLAAQTIVIVSHIFSSGPALDLEEYTRDKAKNLFFIGHPFSFRKDTRSFYRKYRNGKKIKEHFSFSLHTSPLIFYLRDIFFTFWWVLLSKEHITTYIGSDSLVAGIGLILQKLGKVDAVILYTIDYVPNRFDNYFLNSIYHFLDTQCLKHCKIVWNVSPNMSAVRKKTGGIYGKDFAQQIVVPLGVWFNRIPKLAVTRRVKNRLIYMGHILEKQGIDLVIQSLPSIIKEIPTLQLVIIGTGEYEQTIKRLVIKLKMQKYVEFKGYIKSHEDVEKEIAKSMIGLATYKPEKSNYTYFADPGKIKNYLAAGVPVMVTDVPQIAKELEKEKCGIISKYSEKDFSKKVIHLLNNEKKYKKYSDNAISFASRYDWNTIFSQALVKSL